MARQPLHPTILLTRGRSVTLLRRCFSRNRRDCWPSHAHIPQPISYPFSYPFSSTQPLLHHPFPPPLSQVGIFVSFVRGGFMQASRHPPESRSVRLLGTCHLQGIPFQQSPDHKPNVRQKQLGMQGYAISDDIQKQQRPSTSSCICVWNYN